MNLNVLYNPKPYHIHTPSNFHLNTNPKSHLKEWANHYLV